MNKRNFLKLALLGLYLMPTISISNELKQATISMNGELDDDLFVIRANESGWSFVDCFQMHNPKEFFILEGVLTKSMHIPGWIDYNKTISISDADVIFVGLANEREEIFEEKTLSKRTHYKSVELRVDDNVLIPSMMPERNDLPGSPLWFNEDEDEKKFNYYRAWENSIINIGLLFPASGLYSIILLSKQGVTVAKESFSISKYTQNIHFKKTVLGDIGFNPMTEIDGGIFNVDGEFTPDDEKIKELAIYEILITTPCGDMIKIPTPYPFVYINRIFCRSLN